MPRLVEVTVEKALILEVDSTKACDPDSGNRDPVEVTSKARNLDSGDCDPKEIAMKSHNPDFV